MCALCLRQPLRQGHHDPMSSFLCELASTQHSATLPHSESQKQHEYPALSAAFLLKAFLFSPDPRGMPITAINFLGPVALCSIFISDIISPPPEHHSANPQRFSTLRSLGPARKEAFRCRWTRGTGSRRWLGAAGAGMRRVTRRRVDGAELGQSPGWQPSPLKPSANEGSHILPPKKTKGIDDETQLWSEAPFHEGHCILKFGLICYLQYSCGDKKFTSFRYCQAMPVILR